MIVLVSKLCIPQDELTTMMETQLGQSEYTIQDMVNDGLPESTHYEELPNDYNHCEEWTLYSQPPLTQMMYHDCLCRYEPETAESMGLNCYTYSEIYWYHPDYLGNTEFVTDLNGIPYQAFYYTAFGESLVSQHANTGYYSTPYRFNAKELDPETGLMYYGARYYNPQVSVWLSVDAMADKYPSLSPYAFVANNPIMLVDPDGNQIDPASQADWDKNKQNIQNKVTAYEYLHATFGVPAFQEKANTLKGTLSGMAKMEDPNNPTVYKLGQASGGVAETHMNSAGEIVLETNGTTENFVHEVTHGIQYEDNKLGFVPGGKTVSSLQNEIDAYKAELAYKGELTPGINPNVPKVTNANQITRSFVFGIIDPRDGSKLYKDHAILSIYPDMGANRCNAAFPKLNPKAMPGETLRSMFPPVKWKR